ncbi:MAG: uracil phosphoribosyltransferase [Prevotellaceae bacterium]|jgi:uracil phosphoribosyltransferase|nr:uracil phosphoribosyltransferase [Prevotellaceae bacterium]
MLNIVGEKSSVFNRFMQEIRDIRIQKDPMRFRINLERIGEVFAYEISKRMESEKISVETPLGVADIEVPKPPIVLATILRAGLPLHQGMLRMFDRAENAFITAYRKYSKDNSFEIKIEYLSCPSLDNKLLIVADPMIATGASMYLTYRALLEKGMPIHTHIVAPIASKEGVEYMNKRFSKKNVTLWVGAVDDELTVKSYIVPGLGDAGDLAYGKKL